MGMVLDPSTGFYYDNTNPQQVAAAEQNRNRSHQSFPDDARFGGPTPPPAVNSNPSFQTQTQSNQSFGYNPWSAAQKEPPTAPGGVGLSSPGTTASDPTAAAPNAYPAYSNAYGLGSSVSGPAGGKSDLTKGPGNDSSRGFNPWSMMGEANARGD